MNNCNNAWLIGLELCIGGRGNVAPPGFIKRKARGVSEARDLLNGKYRC